MTSGIGGGRDMVAGMALPPSALEAQALLDLPLSELTERAVARRDRAFGNRVTFSPKVFIPLTMLCARSDW